jgi:hypothetical protein
MRQRGVDAVESIATIDWDGRGSISPQESLVNEELGLVAHADDILGKTATFCNVFYRLGAYTLLDRHMKKVRREGLALGGQVGGFCPG